MRVLEKNESRFGEDFADNKKVLDEVSIIRSKGLKNEIAGYITNYVKRKIRDQKIKEAQLEAFKAEQQQAEAERNLVERMQEGGEMIEGDPDTGLSKDAVYDAPDVPDAAAPAEDAVAAEPASAEEPAESVPADVPAEATPEASETKPE